MLRNGGFSLGWTYTHYTPSGAGWEERKCPRARVTLGNAVRETSTLDPEDHKMQVPLRWGLCGSGVPPAPPTLRQPAAVSLISVKPTEATTNWGLSLKQWIVVRIARAALAQTRNIH